MTHFPGFQVFKKFVKIRELNSYLSPNWVCPGRDRVFLTLSALCFFTPFIARAELTARENCFECYRQCYAEC